jgi:O-antigen/teichoic acid export membrane protein
MLRAQVVYGAAAGAAIAVATPVVVPVVFGESYADSVPVMQAIAAYVVFRSLAAGGVDVFKAAGRPQLGVRLALARLVVLVPVLLLAAQLGLTAVALGQAAVALGFAVVTQAILCRLTGLRPVRVLAAVAPGLVVGAATGLATALGIAGGDLLGLEGWWTVVAAAAGAGLGFVVAVLLVDRDLVRTVVRR